MTQPADMERASVVRVIVQGSPGSQSPQSDALREYQDRLGYRYLGEIGTYLSERQTNVAESLVRFEFPSYHLIEIPSEAVYTVIGSLYRQFSDPGSRNFVQLIEPDYSLSVVGAPPAVLGTNFSLTSGKSSHTAYLADLGVDVAHQKGIGGSGNKIAVLDTGVEPGYTVTNYLDLIIPGGKQIDNHGHGSAMVAIIADVAPSADIDVIRVSNSGSIGVWELMAGVLAAAYGFNADIINLSLGCQHLDWRCSTCGGGGNRSTVCEHFFRQLARSSQNGPDPIILAAVGNDSATNGFRWPARYDTLVGIGSISHSRERSLFSNTGTTKATSLYGLCPGGQVDSQDKATEWVGEASAGGTTVQCLGSSPATAYASGLFALLRDYMSPLATLPSSGFLQRARIRARTDVINYNPAEHGAGRLVFP